MNRRERKMFDKLKANKKMQKFNCYACGNEFSSVDHSDAISQTQAELRSAIIDDLNFQIKATTLSAGGEEVSVCKACFVMSLVNLAKALHETHAVDPRDIN